MCAILPDDALLPDEPQIGLVDKRGGLKRVVFPFAAEIRCGAPPELLVDQGHQSLAGLEIALAPRAQQPRDDTGLRCAACVRHRVPIRRSHPLDPHDAIGCVLSRYLSTGRTTDAGHRRGASLGVNCRDGFYLYCRPSASIAIAPVRTTAFCFGTERRAASGD